jgi:hypothetical protein
MLLANSESSHDFQIFTTIWLNVRSTCCAVPIFFGRLIALPYWMWYIGSQVDARSRDTPQEALMNTTFTGSDYGRLSSLFLAKTLLCSSADLPFHHIS